MKFGDPHFPLEGFQNLSKNILMTFKNFRKTSKKIKKLPKDSSKNFPGFKKLSKTLWKSFKKKAVNSRWGLEAPHLPLGASTQHPDEM